MAEINLVESSISDLQMALSTGSVTSVELVARFLCRVSRYDCRGPRLNAIPIINPKVFDEAAASDDRRASGQRVRALEGIPYTVKDSYKVKGMTCASGSPAFQHLIANEDAFTVAAIRGAGGILIGRTNMPSMAYGGMQRGVYGRAESPYNSNYLAAAFASGSSNGSAVATAASFAAFGMGEETVSSGRSPASNNALVAYTPSRGCISIRGNWPLYPTCDVVVPHTRTMHDMLLLLEVITAEDNVSSGDFWRDQPFIDLPKPWLDRPHIFQDIRSQAVSLSKIRIAVPQMYIGGPQVEGARAVYTSESVVRLWERAKQDLEALGAEIVVVPDYPPVTAYENPDLLPDNSPRLPQNWVQTERGPLIAHAWNEFLKSNQDPRFPDISSLNTLGIYPDTMRTTVELKYMDHRNAIHWAQLASYVKNAPLYETEGLKSAITALEGMRKCLLDDYLSAYACDCFVFPAAGDVGAADADSNDTSAEHAWTNGIYYSNGNRALRHLGIPTVTVPMGVMEDKEMPVGLTFAGRSNEDASLLQWANAYERRSQRRTSPVMTPPVTSDTIALKGNSRMKPRDPRPDLKITKCIAIPAITYNEQIVENIHIEGHISISGDNMLNAPAFPVAEILIDANPMSSSEIKLERCLAHGKQTLCFEFKVSGSATIPFHQEHGSHPLASVAGDKIMVIVLARSCQNGRPSGWLGIIEHST